MIPEKNPIRGFSDLILSALKGLTHLFGLFGLCGRFDVFGLFELFGLFALCGLFGLFGLFGVFNLFGLVCRSSLFGIKPKPLKIQAFMLILTLTERFCYRYPVIYPVLLLCYYLSLLLHTSDPRTFAHHAGTGRVIRAFERVIRPHSNG